MLERVLIVEDDDFNVKLLKTMLQQIAPECEILSTYKGSEALALLERKEPRVDLLLLDLHLPEMSGEEILEKVRQIEHYKNLPVFIVSVDGLDEKKYLEMGATDFVLKPFHPDVLTEKLEKLAN